MAPNPRTLVTELGTGLGITGIYGNIGDALDNGPPPTLLNVRDTEWRNLIDASEEDQWKQLIAQAFSNGRYFLQAEDGLGGILPRRVEWQGPKKTVGDESVPADLRVNRVYLVSCKYDSKISHNASPHRVFELLLSTGHKRQGNWFLTVAPDEFQSLYAAVKDEIDPNGCELPDQVQDLNPAQKKRIKSELNGGCWPGSTGKCYVAFSNVVSQQSAERWKQKFKGQDRERIHKRKTLMVHRLIRLCPCPYFILGLKGKQPLRLRVDSPWDWNQRYKLLDFYISSSDAEQPKVDWGFAYEDKCLSDQGEIKGHVEVRWSHGHFNGAPEGKIYLDTDLHQIPGYHLL